MSTSQIPTPHIEAKAGDFAKTVLMPGDPLRARFIAETFLEHPILVNNVRGIQGYTGAYQGKRISVMASGMGMPSIGIYSYELYHFYGVESILRIGSAGAISPLLHVRDIVAVSYTHLDVYKRQERRLASLERVCAQQGKSQKKLTVSVRKPEKE